MSAPRARGSMRVVGRRGPGLSTAHEFVVPISDRNALSDGMPTSRARRTKHRPSVRPSVGFDSQLDLRMVKVMMAADAAEVRGDAREALRIVNGNPLDHEGRPFWRPTRLTYLRQLEEFERALPAWVTSRWMLHQASHVLDPALRSAHRKAVEVAVSARGGLLVLPGTDSVDRKAKVTDHDWLHRQLFLYEYGALRQFIANGASPRLVAHAGHIGDWADASLRAYRLVSETAGAAPIWECLTSGALVTPLDLGASLLLEGPGECVVGRLVPIDGGVMFETAPLPVPDDVAAGVAAAPDDWVEVLLAGCREHGTVPRRGGDSTEGIMLAGLFDFGLLTDVPQLMWRAAYREEVPLPTDVESVVDDGTIVCHAALGTLAKGEPIPYELGPATSAALLEPGVARRLSCSLAPDVEPLLRELALFLSPPAAAVCAGVADRCRAAAS